MNTHIKNREKVLNFLFEELIGPCPIGEEIDCSGEIAFNEANSSYGPFRQKDSGQEILLRDSPTKRYGIGVLYPAGTQAVPEDDVSGLGFDNPDLPRSENAEALVSDQFLQNSAEIAGRADRGIEDIDNNDFDLSETNKYRPSSMGISFLAEIPENSELVVIALGGRYESKKIKVEGKQRIWWLRKPVQIEARFAADSLCSLDEVVAMPTSVRTDMGDLNLEIQAFSRLQETSRKRLITVCIVNRTKLFGNLDNQCLFQTQFHATVISANSNDNILPYPTASTGFDPEEDSIALLYRFEKTFAVGHGCAANWEIADAQLGRARAVSGECLPWFETPSITPDIRKKNGSPLEVDMATLAGLVKGQDGFDALTEVIESYEAWIEDRKKEISSLDLRLRNTAERHMYDCSRCVQRMLAGLDYLQNDSNARKAFELANYAMLLQQVSSNPQPRLAQYDAKSSRLVFSQEYQAPNSLSSNTKRGKWRAFQVAFLLMALESTSDGEAEDRMTVELIWFPTGGGKTEAYLGLAAFSMFMRRLMNQNDVGVDVIMRYTLRLLTTQQFQRASALICAMEYLRKANPFLLGEREFSIGIWLGGSTTPNTRQDAIYILRELQRGYPYARNMFVLQRCPWCRAQMGPLKSARYASKNSRTEKGPKVIGYEQSGETVSLVCPDGRCDFAGGLPIYVIDEDIYVSRPSLVIGTVDKFATLAWKPEARTLFGLDENGDRFAAPPGLIIQDELHLISGPLGSLVGLYETVIEELCTDRRNDPIVPPKIVSSTATIRRYKEQIKALYSREDVVLFPPPGIEAGNSFFAQYDCRPDGTLQCGRMYVGVHAPGLSSMQTAQVRTFTALLQAPVQFSASERDPWWTLLAFFNSLRELGTTLSLFQSDIPDRLTVVRFRRGLTYSEKRLLMRIRELTGRLSSDEIPSAIAALELTCMQQDDLPIDVCLASNIIEVGIDIDRLSLMSIVGQPKTTSQYIQVTGRIGRRWWERPGLVVTIYNPSKARDRSHFEKFRSYHERLYAQVEPTSVTPFSPPALDRALHSLIVAFVRQSGDLEKIRRPYPFPADLIERFREIILPRIRAIDPNEVINFERVFLRRSEEWKRWERRIWTSSYQTEDIPLLLRAGSYVSIDRKGLSWPTITSLRDVDAECRAVITTLYATEEIEDG